jgi:hypothetical protein
MPDSKREFRVWPFLLVAAPIYIYLNLFAFPDIPFRLDGDQLFFWVYALRMSHGELIYRDFFQFTPPGTDLFHLALIRFFGSGQWVMNTGVLLIGIVICWICFSVAHQLIDSNWALLAAFLVLVLLFGRKLDATHHWFSLFWVLCAVRIAMPGRTAARIAVAGVLLAVASCFTQTVGVAGLAALLIVILWEGRCARTGWRIIFRHQALTAMSFAAVFLGLNAALITRVGWKRLWYFQVTYPRDYLIYMHQRFFPSLPQQPGWRAWPDVALHVLVYILTLIVYPGVLWQCWKTSRLAPPAKWAGPALLALSGFFLWLEIITRVNWTRLFVAAVPALILAIWLATRSARLAPPLRTALWLFVCCLALTQTVSRHRHYRRIVQLPLGKVAMAEEDAEKLITLMKYTKPGDFFFQATWLNLYPSLALRSPAFVDMLWPNNVTRPEDVWLTVRQLESKRVELILWSPKLDAAEDPGNPAEYHLGPIRSYLEDHYNRILVFPDQDELWQRK